MRTYTLRDLTERWEAWVLHADGTPWTSHPTLWRPQFLARAWNGFRFFDADDGIRPAQFSARLLAETAWKLCPDVYNDTLPDFRQVGTLAR